jgi:predicted kinase
MIALMMYGYPATGKTFAAKLLLKNLSADYNSLIVSTLEFREKYNLFNLNSEKERNKVYDFLTDHISSIAKDRTCDVLIIDGNFNKKIRREKLYSVLKGKTIYIIKCYVAEKKIIEERLLDRQQNSHISKNKASTIELYNMIRLTGDSIEEDQLFKDGDIGLIEFNSVNNKVERIMLNKKKGNEELIAKIVSYLDLNETESRGN